MANLNNKSCRNTRSKFSQKRESQNTHVGSRNFAAMIPLKVKPANEDLNGRAS